MTDGWHDPGADEPGEWRRNTMGDNTMVTADEYRTAAKVLRAGLPGMFGRDRLAAAHCEMEADRLDREARDEQLLVAELVGVYGKAYAKSIEERASSCRAAGIRAVLAHLRTLGWTDNTTPACTGAGGCDAPVHHHGCFADTGDCDDPTDHPEPDGWQTWQAVPEGVRYKGHDRGGEVSPTFVNRGGRRHSIWLETGIEHANAHDDAWVASLAPFRRVQPTEGDPK